MKNNAEKPPPTIYSNMNFLSLSLTLLIHFMNWTGGVFIKIYK